MVLSVSFIHRYYSVKVPQLNQSDPPETVYFNVCGPIVLEDNPTTNDGTCPSGTTVACLLRDVNAIGEFGQTNDTHLFWNNSTFPPNVTLPSLHLICPRPSYVLFSCVLLSGILVSTLLRRNPPHCSSFARSHVAGGTPVLYWHAAARSTPRDQQRHSNALPLHAAKSVAHHWRDRPIWQPQSHAAVRFTTRRLQCAPLTIGCCPLQRARCTQRMGTGLS